MSVSSTSRVSVLELLPPLTKIEKSKVAALCQTLMVIIKSTSVALEERCLARFDAPVGDNSCKIRALKISALAEKSTKTLITDAQLLIENMQAIDSQTLTPELYFLILARFLHHVKADDGYEKTDPDKLPLIAKRVAKDWIHLQKVRLAQASLHAIQEAAAALTSPRRPILLKMLSPPFIRTYEKRPVAPNFHCMEVLLTRAAATHQPLVLEVAEHRLERPTPTFRHFFFPPPTDLTLPALIIQGKRLKNLVDLEETLDPLLTDPIALLTITAAQDPPYLAGAKHEPIPFNPTDPADIHEKALLDHLTALSHTQGLSQSTPRTFLIQHIYCEYLGTYIKK